VEVGGHSYTEEEVAWTSGGDGDAIELTLPVGADGGPLVVRRCGIGSEPAYLRVIGPTIGEAVVTAGPACAGPGACCEGGVDAEGRVVGGGGIAPLEGGPEGVCGLKKMYFLKGARGGGMGVKLILQLLARAKALGYATCYLETLTGMDAAQKLYRKVGFQTLCGPMGKTGHHGCDRFFALELT